MFYVYKLNEIDADDYDGIETYVSEQLAEDNLDWFPTAKSLSLPDSLSEGG